MACAYRSGTGSQDSRRDCIPSSRHSLNQSHGNGHPQEGGHHYGSVVIFPDVANGTVRLELVPADENDPRNSGLDQSTFGAMESISIPGKAVRDGTKPNPEGGNCMAGSKKATTD